MLNGRVVETERRILLANASFAEWGWCTSYLCTIILLGAKQRAPVPSAFHPTVCRPCATKEKG